LFLHFFKTQKAGKDDIISIVNNKKKIFSILLIIAVSLLCIFFTKDNFIGGLAGQKSEFVVNGNSMQPMFLHNEVINVIDNYYEENEVKSNDIVLFRHSANENLLVKIVKATDKDFLEIKDNNLVINGKVMKNSIKQVYSFQVNELKMLGLYIKGGYLPENTVFVFGDNIGVSKDSRKFGVVPESYVISIVR